MAEVKMSGPTRRKALRLMGVVGLVALGADDVARSPAAAAQPRRPATPPLSVVKQPSSPPTPKPVPVVRPASWTAEKLTATVHPLRHLPEIVPAPAPAALALTIDDGPDPQWTPRILDLLAEQQVKASFFMISEMAREYPGLARRVADAGHQVSNHSRTHPLPFGALSPKRLRAEIVDAQKEIADITGVLHHTRRIRVLGATAHPTAARVARRPGTWSRTWRTPAAGQRFLIRDRDGKFRDLFDAALADAGIQAVLIGVRMPRMTAEMERWVQTRRTPAGAVAFTDHRTQT
ncbi:polysaccharide deacetylase family protein [Spirillospora sp. CA-142024]|uniref:polysaccharide deacetylase family protein n=1 Tax=Spirillospora sp. CA-142024 TaxID=3240036 RepID=UPI003D8E280C